jgi:EAL domain-containing protein (putative c-di-GMP-specific phosphodiesterase class I)
MQTAIEHGVAGKIDRWVILRAIKALMAHRTAGHNTRLTINVTSNSIADPEFVPWLGVALRAARLPSDALILQLVEEQAAAMVRPAQAFVQALRAMHCQSSLSRFGSCEAPFERLKQIPVDYVKLDGQLLESVSNDAEERDRVTKMLGQLQSLGKMSIVPMVEAASMLSVLWQAGANFVQGHYLQPPRPEMDFDFSTAD